MFLFYVLFMRTVLQRPVSFFLSFIIIFFCMPICPFTVYKTCTYNYKVLFKILYSSLVGEGADDNVFIRGYWRLNADQKKALTLCVFREEGFLTVSLRLCVLTILV